MSKQNPNARSKLKKDPGVPNLFPFKDKILKEIEQKRQNSEKEKEQHRENQRRTNEEGLEMDVEVSGMAKLAQVAELQNAGFEEGVVLGGDEMDDIIEDSTKKDTSRKAFNKEFKKVIEQADVILYILDARDPEGSRSREVEAMIQQSAGGEKQLILIMNKIGNHSH